MCPQDSTRSPADEVRDVVYRYRLRPQRGFEYVSASCTALTGYTPEEHYADPDLGFKIVHPEDRPLLEQLAGGDVPTEGIVLRWVTKQGHTVWVEQRNTPIRDDDGEIVAISGIARDIGDRVARERALVERVEYQARLVEMVSDAIVSTDGDRIIRTWNRSAERLYGWTEAEAVGRPIHEVLATEITEAERQRSLADLYRDGTWHGRVTHHHKDGSRIIVDASVSIVRDLDGAVSGMVAVNRDVTELVRLENELLLGRKMQALGRLASGIAHDFNNVLMGVAGAADVLLWHLPDDSPLRVFADEIKRSAASGAAIGRNLLDLGARRTSGHGAKLDDTIRGLTKTLARLLGASIELRVSYETGATSVALDEGSIAQILLNLAANARDAMPGGGTFAIETRLRSREAPPLEQPADSRLWEYAVLTVSDTGCGVDAETIEHMFDPFYTTKPAGKGTGLGLATLYNIVHNAKGRVEVTSHVGEGTTFSLYLPKAERVRPPARSARATANGQSGRLLVVEDDSLVLTVVREYLSAAGFEVVATDGPAAAVERWPQLAGNVDLAVLDLRLPGMTGVHLLERLRETRPELPAVFMTANAQDAHFASVPDITVLQKPFGAPELIEAVRARLDGAIASDG